MYVNKKHSLEDLDDFVEFFPKPLRALMRFFNAECALAFRHIVDRLDLVSKQEYLVQKKMLAHAYEKIKQLEKQVGALEEKGNS